MRTHIYNDQKLYIIDGPDPNGPLGSGATFAVAESKINELRARNRRVPLIQLFHIVEPGLILAEHIFRGLNRPLLYEADTEGDASKFVFTWRAKRDWDFADGKRFDPDGLREMPHPPGKIYAVIATPNTRTQYETVSYWIDRWFWVDEATDLPGAPVDYKERFLQHIKGQTNA